MIILRPTKTEKPLFLSPCFNLLVSVVEAVDPVVLSMKLVDVCEHHREEESCVMDLPSFVEESFSNELHFEHSRRHVLATLGQFSIIRLERDTQLLIPSYDYCLPDKECVGSNEEDPCSFFSKIRFPVDEFFPPDTLEHPEGYCEARGEQTP